MSALKNYDLRLDFTPYPGGLMSVSWFRKDIERPIEYVQRRTDTGVGYVTVVNYPEGELSGYEFELRQHLGELWRPLNGLSVGANATFIDSEVKLLPVEFPQFENAGAPLYSRDMTNAPEHLYNLYLTYDLEKTGTQVGLFYTVRGDTLVAGADAPGGVAFVPSIYETEFGTLNFSIAQKLGKHWKLKFAAKNLTNPRIEEVYRSEYIADDITKTSYRKGIDFSISITGEWNF
jgi:outer membrane receptor protein involved in Fe transport